MAEVVIITAVSLDGIIGKEGKLPWHVSEDMKRFKSLTTGYPVIMGRKTAEGFPKALPNRRNVILSQSGYSKEGFETAESLGEALLNCRANERIFIIGGGKVYKKALEFADRIELTRIQQRIGKGSDVVYFPDIDPAKWEIVYSRGGAECIFYTYLPKKGRKAIE